MGQSRECYHLRGRKQTRLWSEGNLCFKSNADLWVREATEGKEGRVEGKGGVEGKDEVEGKEGLEGKEGVEGKGLCMLMYVVKYFTGFV